MQKIVKGDEVIVLTGKDKNRRGEVLKVVEVKKKYGKKQRKAYVSGVNLIKKGVKPNPQKNQQGGIVEREAPINISNLALLDPTTDKPSRVGFKILEDGKKVRYYKASGEIVAV